MIATLEQPQAGHQKRDPYRFGDGPAPVPLPGTRGWTADDFEDPLLRALWDEGRYEIIDGVLTVMPAAFFGDGSCAVEFMAVCRRHFESAGVVARSSAEVDIQVRSDQLIRADGVVIFGDDVAKVKALKFALTV